MIKAFAQRNGTKKLKNLPKTIAFFIKGDAADEARARNRRF